MGRAVKSLPLVNLGESRGLRVGLFPAPGLPNEAPLHQYCAPSSTTASATVGSHERVSGVLYAWHDGLWRVSCHPCPPPESRCPWPLVSDWPIRAALDAGCRMPDVECRTPDVGCRMPDAGCWVLYAVRGKFRSKPGPLSRPLPWVSPWHRRLDWCLWIAALGPRRRSPWFPRLLLKLMDNDSQVRSR